MYHTNIFMMQDTIFFIKVKHGKKKQLIVNINGTLIAEIIRICNTTNIFLKYG